MIEDPTTNTPISLERCSFKACEEQISDPHYCSNCDRNFCAEHAGARAHYCGTASALRPEEMA